MRTEIADQQWSIKIERSRRFGILASAAFARFVWFYRKYDEDQPRDEHGRWVDTGAGEEDPRAATTGAVVLRRYRTGDPKVDDVSEKLEAIVADSMEQAGPGSGSAYGVKVHGLFAQGVIAADIPGIRSSGVEVSFVKEELATYGAEGSVRTDVILRSNPDATGSVTAIWDLKTGTATLLPSRAAELRREVGVGAEIPVIELHAIKGVSIKSILSRQLGS